MPGGVWCISLALMTGPSPGVAATRPGVVDVTTFGAKPDDGKDDTRAVQAAIDACRKHPHATLLFPKGRYDFVAGSNPRDKGSAMAVVGFRALTISGHGATLVGHGLTRMFSVKRCKELLIEGLAIDWDRPPFSQGTITQGRHF